MAAAVLACGRPLVDDGYGGEPKLTLRGQFEGSIPGLELEAPFVRGAIFWNPGLASPFASFDLLVEQPATGRPFQFPGPVEWHLFELPGPEAMAEAAGGASLALGLPLFYLDADGDLRRGPGEDLVMHTPGAALLFAPRALAAAESPTGIAVPAGYHLLSTPLWCGRPAPPPADGDCGVPLGAPCRRDADCGGAGACLLSGPWPAAEGLCVIPEPPPDGCRPRGGALVRDFREPGRELWAQACQAPEDCGRGHPFQCDYTFGACLPTAHLRFAGEHALQPRPFCAPAG